SQIRFERPDAALADNHFVIAARHYVLRGEQGLLDGGRRATLEQHRLVQAADLPKKIEVLHVSGADLQNVNVPDKHRYLRRLHDLGHNEQVKAISGLPQVLKALFAESLK